VTSGAAVAPGAVVTGATGGIGSAIAGALAGRGYRLVIQGYEDAARGAELAAELTTDAVYHDADVSDPSAAAGLVALAERRWGRLDVLINNAGIGERVPHADLDAVTPEFWNRMLGVNLLGPWHLTRAAADLLAAAPDGCVINMASIAGLTVSGSSIPYAVSKAGLVHLTRLLAVACGPRFRVNAVAPGYVETPRTAGWDDVRAVVATRSPLRRLGQPEDVAAACLAMIDSPYSTGAVLTTDGGLGLV
jgi:ketoreductase RED2